MRTHRRAFTLIEAVASTVALATLGATGYLAFGQQQGGQPGGGQAPGVRDQQALRKDSTQIRGIGQAMIVWAQNNKDSYPLPSLIDTSDVTVKEKGASKDISANVYSLLVYCGAISTEILVSPLEKNPSVVNCDTYMFAQPKKAAKPAEALWDPALTVSLAAGSKGNVSYAHLQPCGERKGRWSNTFAADEVVVSTRGPEITRVTTDEPDVPTPTFAKPDSLSLSLVGDGKKWSGHAAFNDNHVELKETTLEHQKPYTGQTRWKDADDRLHPDIWFYDEPQDKKSVNTFLGLFTKAGEKPAEWKGIWD